jgi:hypothetical protein
LLHGSVMIGLNSGNTWKTRIEAALVSDIETAYLTTACRAERVQVTGDLIGRRYSEVSVISTDKTDWIIRSGAGIWHPLKIRFSEALHYGEFQGGTNVSCPEVNVRMLTFGEVYDDISMQVRYNHQGEAFEIICPCRYTNFANPEHTAPDQKNYVQPISGYVLFKNNQRYYQAYVVAHIVEDGNTNCEVVLRVPEFVMDLKRNVGGFLTSVLRNLFLAHQKYASNR